MPPSALPRDHAAENRGAYAHCRVAGLLRGVSRRSRATFGGAGALRRVAAGTATSSAVWLTVPVLATMLALTLAALRRVLAAERAPGAAVPGAPVAAATAAQGRGDRVVRWLLGGTLGVYAGWSTAAVWVNVGQQPANNGDRRAGKGHHLCRYAQRASGARHSKPSLR
jgi:hypothetical protein